MSSIDKVGFIAHCLYAILCDGETYQQTSSLSCFLPIPSPSEVVVIPHRVPCFIASLPADDDHGHKVLQPEQQRDDRILQTSNPHRWTQWSGKDGERNLYDPYDLTSSNFRVYCMDFDIMKGYMLHKMHDMVMKVPCHTFIASCAYESLYI